MTEREQGRGEGPEPLDEEAAWAQIVAAYGEEPASPPEEERRGGGPGGTGGAGGTGEEDKAGGTGVPGGEDGTEGPGGTGEGGGERSGPEAGGLPVRGFTVYAAGSGPRDWSPAEPSDDDLGEDDEGHFVPPEPPPLPKGDPASRFAWLAVLGGPLLLMLTILFQQPVTWWIATLGIGGFLGGFAALVTRMRDDEDDDFEDPGRGAVV
ncbi:hypothetical protein [Streptomyces pini]|uniref:DUF308 domain-containing protein n=1 Tax=Streptomyces pini TaxID=1520580 RepID=A0A1I3WFK3_9ACTN|nr:hypothetical protein [Streptomyces pini]SFK06170.1 hypothetical protein SAMN05192584_103269 [Streptomyces pini]